MRKSTRAFQLHFHKQRSTVREIIAKAVNRVMDKKAIFFIWDAPFAKLLISFSEDIGTVTGTHIAGTGDDSSTVLVKKKKKQKKKLQIRFKLKNQKLFKKRIIDHVLAIQQKV